MGKRKKTRMKVNASKDNEEESKQHSEQKFTIDDLIQKVEEYIENFNFEMAEKFCVRILETSPNNVRALNMVAAACLEIGKTDEAICYLKRAVEIEPDKGFSKYMTLGELLEGQHAVEYLKKGVELMINEKKCFEKEDTDNPCENSDIEKITDRDISNAFCSLAEIYLTDFCLAEDAEASCKSYCNEAIQHDQNNPDAYQVMANCLLSEQKNEEAREALLKGMNLWRGIDDPVLKSSRIPSYDSRISLSKMLIEINEFDTAADVLGELLSEDDEVVQVWYLLGWNEYLKEQDYNSVVYYLEMAQKLFSQSECDDEPLLEHINELLLEVKEKLNDHKDFFSNNDAGENSEDDYNEEEIGSMDTTT
ncbi:probable assembly chaperone of rpl4 [Xenia sp. Carnegie-2017]|uniref:probable assembly chaperone of rpl4 n=1 Tax=Xenia sp. Carnegie-2017 TaxID=2897299 RepID=UPI001F03A177|nr:probable assembly chaperone of rpl4 [Xenia sp. Carnegie-2017]